MKKIISLFLIIMVCSAYSQSAKIDTFNLNKSERFKELQLDKMNFPIVNTGKVEIDSLINFDLKNKFTYNEYPNESIESTLLKWAGDQIIFIDFKVTYNKNGMLSLNVSAESCGAYCTYWTNYFNYSTVTGKIVEISKIVAITGAFKTRIFKDKETQFKKQKVLLNEMLHDSEAAIDQSTYEWALEYYESCEKTFNLEVFSIYPEYIEIIKDCYLPNAIKNLAPIIALKYKFIEINEYLKIKN